MNSLWTQSARNRLWSRLQRRRIRTIPWWRSDLPVPGRAKEPPAPRYFENRVDAGAYLATRLEAYASQPNLLVLAIPRGGVPVGYEIARRLHAPLDILVIRKLGLPGQPELAIGAIASGGIHVLNQRLISQLAITKSEVEMVAHTEQRELERRERVFRRLHPAIDPRGRTVILVDDGLATGATMQAGIATLRQRQVARLVVAVPVAQTDVYRTIATLADDAICPIVVDRFVAVSRWYVDFAPTTDDEVRDLLRRAPSVRAAA